MMDDAREKKQTFEVSVILIDHSEVIFRVNKRDRGQALLDAVFESVHCKEPKYYGLQFQQDIPDISMKWLDPAKSIRKQFKRGYPLLLYYRIKHYVHDISRITCASTRYQLFLQVKMDVLEQRLNCPASTAALLTAYAVQSELGDFHSEEQQSSADDYLQNFSFLPHKTKEFTDKVRDLHVGLRGMEPIRAELLFLCEARKLRTYGVDLHRGKTRLGEPIEVGVGTDGISLYKDSDIYAGYDWSQIMKISFKRKQFLIQLQRTSLTKDEPSSIEFSMENYRACKRLWRNCVDCHSFYRHDREKSSSQEKMQRNGIEKADRLIFGLFAMGNRNSSKVKYSKSGRGLSGFSSPQKSASSKMLNLNHCSVPEEEFYKQDLRKETRRLSAPPSVTLCAVDGFDTSLEFSNHNSSFVDFAMQGNVDGNEVLETYYDSPFVHPPRNSTNDQELVPDLPEDLVLVRLKPDKEGRFGFNVKGGVDLKMPITISKIAPASQAGKCSPKLNIGDEIIQINGRDASSFTHDQAVNFIRSTKEKHFGELILLVRREPEGETNQDDSCFTQTSHQSKNDTTSEGDSLTMESSMRRLQALIENHEETMAFNKLPRKNPDLTMRQARLPENVHRNRYRDISPYDETRVVLRGWETDYINANHIYMAIGGTDVTTHYIASQGPLKETCGDFWAMLLEQGSTLIVMVTSTAERGLVKCHQYWPDVGESLQFGTLKVECFSEQLENSVIAREIVLTSLGADGEESRSCKISHFQYVGWPDHGVPDNSADFLAFVKRIRTCRDEPSEPTVIHCSAGIGRTGVFIAIETAMCLLEANQPVCPMQITRRLRDQRAMMIQTAVQFRFVCKAVYRVYQDRFQQSPALES